MLIDMIDELDNLIAFLGVPTPEAWFDYAKDNIPVLLNDHLACEKKAALSAMKLMHEVDSISCKQALSKIAREELKHYDMLLDLLHTLNIPLIHVTASNYVKHMLALRISPYLEDGFLIAAIIEARSCERMAKLIQYLPAEAAKLYQKLVLSEWRHYTFYLNCYDQLGFGSRERLVGFLEAENKYIQSKDSMFCFHSGLYEG